MEVNPGFKQTEIGVIPEDWEYTSVGQLVRDGILEQPMDGNHGEIHPKSSDFVSYGIPFVMANNIRGGRVDLSSCAFIRKEQADSLRKGFSKTGDVLLTHKATIGSTAIVGDVPFEYIMLTPQVTYYRVRDPARLSNLYLRQYFDGFQFQNTLATLSGGGTRAYIGITAQLQLPVVLPLNRNEQEAIAEVLSDADALIESIERLLFKKRDLKQGAMQELLTGKKRLPTFSGEWELKTFGEMAQLRKERVDPRRTGVREFCVELEHIGQGTGCLLGHTATDAYSSLKSVFRKDDVLFGKLRAYLRKYWLASREGVCSTEIWVLVARVSLLTPEYLFQLVKTDRFIETASSAYGTHMPRSDWNVMRKFELHVPLIDEQTAIAHVLSDMDEEIAALVEKLAKARMLKQGMMQELLTGRIRLV